MLPGIPGECPHQCGTYRFPAPSAVPAALRATVVHGVDAGMVTVGGVVSRGAPLDTVTVNAADVVLLPAAWRATALRLWDTLAAVVVSQLTEYGAEVSSAP